jgi:two-component system phosphate regulon sensor histidine kinase PhoR
VRPRFFAKLLLGCLLLVAANALLTGWLAGLGAEKTQRVEIEETLAAQARLLAEVARPLVAAGDLAQLERRVRELGDATGSRFTVAAADGRVLADSAERPEIMQNHRDRPEFVAAAAAGRGSAERTSDTTHVRTIYVCLAVAGGGPSLGFVRAALPRPGVAAHVERLRGELLAAVAAGAALSLAGAWFVARRLSRPLASMRTAALALAEGGPVAAIPHESGDELGDLARAFNRMASRLRERLDELERERSKLATVLESMAEGVLAVDEEERLLHCNAAARRLLSIGAGGLGRPLLESVRAPELVDALRRARARGDAAAVVEEIDVHPPGGARTLSVHAARLSDRGAVAVLLDVTELRRLETVRRDFVANVSHELKTPLAAMRGLVETLLEDERMEDAVRRRFLGKLADQVTRLADLASDLLHLSRAESERTRARVELDLGAAASAACERFAAGAAAKKVALACDAAPVVAPCDPEAIAQVLDNLLDNAIKYTPPGGSVRLRVASDLDDALLEVEDTGVGIEPAEQKRVFERFYRVDKARSRDVPGTGLGLSIVKHLVDAHGGGVELESWPGRGSTFRVRLPKSGAGPPARPPSVRTGEER